MITAKFGGTAITPQNLQYVKNLVTNNKAIVVSAIGKEYSQDEKTTDLLVEYYRAENQSVWDKIASKYRRLVDRNCINVDVDELLFDAKRRARKYSLEYCMSLGEELSAKVVSKYLNADYIEAEKAVVFGARSVNVNETVRRLKDAFSGCNLGVIGGFYGGRLNTRTTFSRGGSDVTGALVAVATSSELYENWTDVYGVCSANPAVVHNVETIPAVSYSQMRLLSLAGAEVLHPDAVLPVEKYAIPIKIDNYYNPCVRSTLVSNCPSLQGLLSIAEKRHGDKTLVTVVHNYGIAKIQQIIEYFVRHNIRFEHIFDQKVPICSVRVLNIAYSPCKVELITDKSIADELYKCFRLLSN